MAEKNQRDRDRRTGGRLEGGRGRGRGEREDREPQEEGGRSARELREGREGKERVRARREKERLVEGKSTEYIETLIDVFRCSATVKGGRRLSFGALVAVGDGQGRVGIGYGKAKEVPGAIQKAIKQGHRSMIRVPMVGDGTIPHSIRGKFGASEVVLIPAAPGTGLIAGAPVKAILEAAGFSNLLTKTYGSTNSRNVVKAVMDGLSQLRSREMIESLRGVKLA